ncbi:hypothetical protein FKM82_010767 [Ascaphus truei]
MADEEAEVAKEKSFKLLGILDVRNTPCARESVLYGSVGALVIGLGHFIATSRVRRSCDLAVGGFILSTFGCWYEYFITHVSFQVQHSTQLRR